MTRLVLPENVDITKGFDLNQMFINQSGHTWEEFEGYREHFVIYKAKGQDYYQMRNLYGVYYYNFSNLEEGKRGIDSIIDMYERKSKYE